MADDTRTYKGEVDASEIFSKIEKGEDVEYDNVIIKGNLDISGLKLPIENEKPVIISKISIINSRFDGFVKFDNAIIKKEIGFSGTIFDGKDDRHFNNSANFSLTRFAKKADFKLAQFNNNNSVWFNYAGFEDQADFRGAHFDYASFDCARFTKHANFVEAQFDSGGVFKWTMFDAVFFDHAQFGDDANFTEAQFDYANFHENKFSRNAIFHKARFGCNANFKGIQVSGDANFDSAQFNGIADFSGAQFHYTADFINTRYNGEVSLWGAQFEEIRGYGNLWMASEGQGCSESVALMSLVYNTFHRDMSLVYNTLHRDMQDIKDSLEKSTNSLEKITNSLEEITQILLIDIRSK